MSINIKISKWGKLLEPFYFVKKELHYFVNDIPDYQNKGKKRKTNIIILLKMSLPYFVIEY